MSLDMYYHILDTINPVTAMSMRMVVSALDLHPVYKDQGSDYFYSNGAEWWTTQVGCCRDRATARAIISTALFILAVRSETALTYFMANTDRLLRSFDDWCLLQECVLGHDPHVRVEQEETRSQTQSDI